MTEVRDQRSVVRNQRPEINVDVRSGGGVSLCPACLCVQTDPDLRLLISGLYILLFALCLPAAAQQPAP
jgi:hypothetical protein